MSELVGVFPPSLNHDPVRRALDCLQEGFQIIGYDWHYVYVNPAAARHGRRPAEELVGYTFAAMESWAADRGAGRLPGETAREFVDRILEEYPRFEVAGQVAGLVARVAYSQVPLPATAKDTLAIAWEQMETT